MSKTTITYLGESGTHFILKVEHNGDFIGIGEMRKSREEWIKKYSDKRESKRMRCKHCGKEVGKYYSDLEEHLWTEHRDIMMEFLRTQVQKTEESKE